MCKVTSEATEKEQSIYWKVGVDPVPETLDQREPVASLLVPRPVAWCSVDDNSVSLLDGYTAAAYTPPYLYFAATALPAYMLAKLQETGRCTLSAATVREPAEALQEASKGSETAPQSYTFGDLGLKACKTKEDYPVAVATSPIKMFCSLEKLVPLEGDESMALLIVETFVVDGKVLSPPTGNMKTSSITAKIDAELIQALASLGRGRFSKMTSLRSMPRPRQQEDGSWTSTDFDPAPPTLGAVDQQKDMEWNFRKDGRCCPLGFNPVTALVMPRPIGWISTYSKTGRVPHVAPYSFFMDIARGTQHPIVAFSGFRKDGDPKDAQKDAEETGCFCWNMVTEELAVPMNLSAAELKREESEFEVAGLSVGKAKLVDAPVVRDAKIHFECEYVKTVDAGGFSIVVGKVVAVSVSD
jgi:flavin reductase (DIM6/NTAB) family NADH-FMN oxidoreductase RutF